MRVYVDCLGCEQRELDTQRIITYLRANEIELVPSPRSCDYAILVTCAVDKAKEDKSISRLEEISRELPVESRLIVGGCLPSISRQRINNYRVYTTFSPRNLESLDFVFGEAIHRKMVDIPTPNRSVFDNEACLNRADLPARQEYDLAKDGFKIVIDDGCLLFCSYCVIKNATGRLKSKPLEVIVAQFKKGIADREPTIMLMGGDTGAYGRDIGLRFYDLLEALVKHPGNYKLFIHDFNINWLIEDLEKYTRVLEASEKDRGIRAATFPIQSGSDRILRLMRRPYTHRDCVNALKRVKESSPSLGIGTHIITGFPTESEQDFQETLGLLQEVDFDFISCFLYSENSLARSARIREKVSREVMEERALRMKNMFGDKVSVFGV